VTRADIENGSEVAVKVWVEVSEERLAGNFRAVAEAAGAETEVLAVVKANAYGHGLERCGAMLARAGARWLGVTCVNEGARVRRALDAAGSRAGEGILVMCGFLPEDVAGFAEHGLTPVAWTMEHVGWLRGCAGMRVHVEVDTGMGRQGVRAGAELEALLEAMGGAGLVLNGIFTHFCASEVAGSELTRTQQRRFEGAVAQVRARGLRPAWVHAGNSSTVDNPAQVSPWLVELAKSVGARAMVRSGLALYGYCLPIEGVDAEAVRPKVRRELRPVMQWKTRVLAVRELVAGETVGYGATFTAPRAQRVALLGVGYADGLRRELSGSNERPGGWVMVGGRRAEIVGRVSMNLTTVDVSGTAGVAVGDEVVLLGDGVTAEDHARIAGTIAYEILCGVRER
jgi:alanine racemase